MRLIPFLALNRALPWLCALAATIGGQTAIAASFEVAAAPARFELSAKSGSRIGQSLEVHNVGGSPANLNLRTIDWSYSEAGQITYHDELLEQSCRPWVTLERNQLEVAARGKRSFRFQLDVPADAPRQECRFMIAIEGIEPAMRSVINGGGASMSLPVNGRIAVAVYVSINEAVPKLELQQIAMQEVDGKLQPFLTISNTGDAHGRLVGYLDGKDANGDELSITADASPILPGQTRQLPLRAKLRNTGPRKDDGSINTWAVPVDVNGVLDWDDGSFNIKAVLNAPESVAQ